MYLESPGTRPGRNNRADKGYLQGSRSDLFTDGSQSRHVFVQMDNNDAETARQKLLQLRRVDLALSHPPVRRDRDGVFRHADIIGTLAGIIACFDNAPKRRPAKQRRVAIAVRAGPVGQFAPPQQLQEFGLRSGETKSANVAGASLIRAVISNNP